MIESGQLWSTRERKCLFLLQLKGHRIATLLQVHAFMLLNAVAFLASLSIILLLVSGLPLNRRKWMWLQMVIMWVAISTQVATYFVTLRHISPRDMAGTLREVTEISVLTWLTLIVVVFVGNVLRLNLWVLRKYGLIKGKERDSQGIDDDQEDVLE